MEDWITDSFHVVDDGGQHGTGIRRLYSGQLILDLAQFQRFVSVFEPYRKEIERLLADYSEEDDGSWRDYCDVFSRVIPEGAWDAGDALRKSLAAEVPQTKSPFE